MSVVADRRYRAHMAYPAQFHRLVLIGNQFGDVFNTTLSIAKDGAGNMDHVSDTLLAAVAAAVADWWDDTGVNGPEVAVQARLTSIKLNRIGTDGKYVDAATMEHVYGSFISGGGPNVFLPPQLATVATLRTDVERGKASKGRMFLPVCSGFNIVGSDGRASSAAALRCAQGVASLIDRINTIYNSPPGVATPGHVAIMSNIGSGTTRTVTSVTVGRVTDTMRSRRSSLIEGPETAPVS